MRQCHHPHKEKFQYLILRLVLLPQNNTKLAKEDFVSVLHVHHKQKAFQKFYLLWLLESYEISTSIHQYIEI